MRPTGCLDVVFKATGCEAAQVLIGLTVPKEAFILSSAATQLNRQVGKKNQLEVYLFSSLLSDTLHENVL